MSWISTVRRLGAVAAVAALTVATASPAFGQSDPVTIDVFVSGHTTVPAGGSNDVTQVTIGADRAATVDNLALTFDVSDLAGVATIDVGSLSCATSGAELVCTNNFSTELWAEPVGLFDLEISADPSAVAGDSGEVTLAVSADGVEPASHTATVTVGAPVDLAASDEENLTAALGEAVAVQWTVHNAGSEPAEGVALWVGSHFGLRQQPQYSNCVYYPHLRFPDIPGNSLCTFDVVLEPGTTYTLSSPLAIEVGADALAPSQFGLFGEWRTRTDGQAFVERQAERGLAGEPGSGPALALEQAGGGAPAPIPDNPLPAADVDPSNDFISVLVDVEGDNQPDFAAVGDELGGEAGDVVTAEVGVENLGPASGGHDGVGDPANRVRVTVPEGTTAIEVPAACSPLVDGGASSERAGEPGAAEYLCESGIILPADKQEVFPFVLRIDEVIADATGAVQVNQSIGEPTPPSDYNPDNDEAVIVVNPAGGSGGDGLPVTGTATWTIAAAGGLLLALGAAGLLLLRRRRTRFVA